MYEKKLNKQKYKYKKGGSLTQPTNTSQIQKENIMEEIEKEKKRLFEKQVESYKEKLQGQTDLMSQKMSTTIHKAITDHAKEKVPSELFDYISKPQELTNKVFENVSSEMERELDGITSKVDLSSVTDELKASLKNKFPDINNEELETLLQKNFNISNFSTDFQENLSPIKEGLVLKLQEQKNDLQKKAQEELRLLGQEISSIIPAPAGEIAKNPFNYVGDPRTILKMLKQYVIMSGKTPFRVLFDIFLNSIMNLGALYVYFPSLMINLPNTSLENILPDKGQCKLLFGKKENCKTKLKCFFMNCNVMQDKKGYYEKEKNKIKNIKGGGSSLKSFVQSAKERVQDQLEKEKEEFMETFSLPNLLFSNTNANNQDIQSEFKQFVHSFSPELAKDNMFKESEELTLLYRNLIYSHLNHVNLYKFLCVYEMMDYLFKDNIEDIEKDMQTIYAQMYDKDEQIKIQFPILGALLDIPDERIQGLMAQAKSTSNNSDETDVTLKNWIPCKNCTLGNTSSKAIQKALNKLTAIEQLDVFVKKLFETFVTNFMFEKFTMDQYLAVFIENYNIFMTPKHLKDIEGNNELKRLLFMIPNITGSISKGKDELNEFKFMYLFFKRWNFDSILRFCLIKKLYLINQSILSKTLMKNKEKIKDIFKVCNKYFINNEGLKNKSRINNINKLKRDEFYHDIEKAKKISITFSGIKNNKKKLKQKNEELEEIFEYMISDKPIISKSLKEDSEVKQYTDEINKIMTTNNFVFEII